MSVLSITLDVLHVKWRLRDLFENHPGRSSLLVSASRGLDMILTLLQRKREDVTLLSRMIIGK